MLAPHLQRINWLVYDLVLCSGNRQGEFSRLKFHPDFLGPS